MPVVGIGSVAGVATEVTYGTYEATNDWLPYQSCDLTEDRDYAHPGHLLPTGSLTASAGTMVPRDAVHLATHVRGSIRFVPHYDHRSTSAMFKHLLKSAATQTGAGPYTYTYESGITVSGLSIQQVAGYSAELSDNTRRFTGLVCSSFSISLNAGGFVVIDSSWIGTGATEIQAISGSPSIVDSEEVIAAHSGATISWNSQSLIVGEATVSVDWKIGESPIVGAYATAKPQQTDFPDIRITGKVKVQSEALHDSFRAGDSSDWVCTLTGTTNNQMVITGQNAKIVKCTLAFTGAGEQYYDCEWVCRSGTAKSGLKVTIRNDNATAES
jgi:hypothetical protein